MKMLMKLARYLRLFQGYVVMRGLFVWYLWFVKLMWRYKIGGWQLLLKMVHLSRQMLPFLRRYWCEITSVSLLCSSTFGIIMKRRSPIVAVFKQFHLYVSAHMRRMKRKSPFMEAEMLSCLLNGNIFTRLRLKTGGVLAKVCYFHSWSSLSSW